MKKQLVKDISEIQDVYFYKTQGEKYKRYHKCVSSQEALEKAIKEGKIFIEVVQQKTLF